ncbi:DUF4136 domain-containing protein [Kordiimonas lipolytica]|uniref:DUF4136 domain-containing protein n=1 Tax=Kordiimonas lipolytica TaxID=1662421 RepID=A0ABV8U814_9PROT|nr:DUF4136 domain-containing protein [Kordiimonas lipolytica]
MTAFMSRLKPVLAGAMALAVAACTNTFRSDVATFHELPAPSGEKVSILPMDEAKQDSLEFRQYAAILGNHLRLEGYEQAGNGKPDLIVGFDVMINDGREKLDTRMGFSGPRPFYWRSYWHYGYFWDPYDPFYRHNTEVVARTVYTATLVMEVRKPDGTLLFEGRAETETRTKAVPEVVPLLAEALFVEFPGPSGVTRHIRVDLDDTGK